MRKLEGTRIATITMLAAAASITASRAEDAALGKKVYERSCAVCHGSSGDGKGAAAYLLYPRPRDFTTGVYKFRSTPSGSAPTDADLDRVVRGGLPGTPMPSWGAALSDAEVAAVIGHVKAFAPEAFRTAPAPIAMTPAPKVTPELLATGKHAYARMGCAACHGEKGTGDGPAARTLADTQGYPIRPFDFTRAGSMKGGSTIADVYRTFTTGVDGTPMPSFQEAATDADRWALAAYVDSLGDRTVPPPPAVAGRISVARVGSIPAAPDDAAWRKVGATLVPLRPIHAVARGVDRVSVRAVEDGKRIAFLLEWDDPVQDLGTLTVDSFRDGAAIQFPMAPVPAGESIFFGMGERKLATNIWHWKSDWEGDVRKLVDVAAANPNMAVDMYPAHATRTASDAGNLMPPMERTSSIEDLNATGFATLTSQARERQNVSGAGRYADGRWRVVFSRDVAAKDAGDADLATVAQVAFAVWNGSAGERNGQKSVSEWVVIGRP